MWGTGEGTTWVSSNRFFLFSVFLCDFRVFRAMMRSAKRIPYMKPKYIQRIHTVIPGSFHLMFLPSPVHPHKKRKRKTTAGSLEGFAPGFANQRFALRLASLACSQVSFENVVANCSQTFVVEFSCFTYVIHEIEVHPISPSIL